MAQQQIRLSPFGNALSGSGGAVLALCLTYPLDIVKTRLQVQTKDSAFTTHYSSMTDAIVQIVRTEGYKGLYSGLPSALLGVASTNFAYFYWYSFVRTSYQRYLKRTAQRQGLGASNSTALVAALEIGTAMELLLGAVAGAMAQLCTIPVSVVTTRQQTQLVGSDGDSAMDDESDSRKPSSLADRSEELKPKSKQQQQQQQKQQSAVSSSASVPSKPRRLSIQEVLFQILREDGWQGLWCGLKPALVLTINPAITYGVFERMKTAMLRSKPTGSKSLSSMEIFILGLICKTLATVITYPYIMAKVRLQWKAVDYEINEKVRYKSAMDVLRRVWQSEGLPGIYKGMRAQVSKAVLTQALLFVIKDKLNYFTWLLFAFLCSGNISSNHIEK